MRAAVVGVSLVACGRLAFESHSDGRAAGDVAGDVITGDSGSGSSAGFCASLSPAPKFCDDFDEGQAVGSGWTSIQTQLGGSNDLATDVAKSPTTSLRHWGSAQAGSGVTYGCLNLNLPGTIHHIVYNYELYLDSRPATTGPLEIGSVNFSVPMMSFYTDLMVWPSGSDTYRQEYAQQGSAFQSHDVPFAPITAGTWHHVQMIIDLDTATHTFSIDGMTLSSGATQYPVVPATTVVQDGMNYTNDPVPAWSLHTDNVTIDYQ